MDTDTWITCRDLRVRREAFTLEVPELLVPKGEVVGLVGPNGAGKTTLLEVLCGLRHRTGGTVRVVGLDPGRAPGRVRARVGYMTDDLPLWDLKLDKLLERLKEMLQS